MNRVSDPAEPELAPPGAGLPAAERFAASLMLRWGLRWTNRERSAALFAREREAVLTLARGCPPESASRRVLIERLRGMEDSSRHWSVYMTVEHLRIVNEGVGRIIAQLARGEVPARATSTADVKPRPDVTAAVLGDFERACAEFAQIVAGIPNLRTGLKHRHPWFGPLDASEWHYLAGFHQKLHRVQIERIIEGSGPTG